MKHNVKRHAVVQPLDESIRLIPLTQGKNATIDATDHEWLSQWNWCARRQEDGRWYAIRSESGRTILMHRFIVPSDKPEVDHRDGDGLNNRRSNLFPCSTARNQRNRGPSRRSKSGYKGVHWSAKRQKWVASIHLGSFETKEEACRTVNHCYEMLLSVLLE